MTSVIPQHILVPHDFSETADHALFFALDLAESLGARVTVMHAYEVDYGFPESAIPAPELLSQIRESAGAALEGVIARASKRGVPVAGLLRQGTPWSEIDEVAGHTKADLVVMGTHGRRGIARALLGSVAERVVRTAPCPVLTVRAPEAGAGQAR
jgi:nucleotide-binding universal stress UspA family protein